MYALKIEKILKAKHISVGDRIKTGKYEGLLMPKPDMGDPSSLVIKLDNGYNIGVKADGVRKIKSEWKQEIRQKPVTKVVFNKNLPTISIIGTGGTIASKVDYRIGGVYASFSADDIAKQISDLKDIANIEATQVMSVMSEDMMPGNWAEIAKAVAKHVNAGVRGVIVTHGTDTLHYTAAALSFMLKYLPVPVALVGAQRSSDRGSSDTVMNVSCAANFVANSDVAEVCTVMHGSINDDYCLAIRGVRARKMHTSRRDAFKSINSAPIAKIWWKDRKIEILDPSYAKRSGKKVTVDGELETRVALIKTYPGFDPGVIDFYLKKGYKGFVIEGTGMGHVATMNKLSLLKYIDKIIAAGLPVVITSQAIYGRVHPNAYTNLRELSKRGAIFADDMLSEVAYVKLMHVLPKAKTLEDVRKLMLQNVAGEISGRTEVVDPE